MTTFYSGIGSRETPPKIKGVMEEIGLVLGESGLILRSGHADGADLAFERGAKDYRAQIFVPWPSFNKHHAHSKRHTYHVPNKASMETVDEYHPSGPFLKHSVKKLHARNAQIVLGYGLDNPSKFVVCWTYQGKTIGGTAQGIRIAEAHYIPVFNLGDKNQYRLFMERLEAEDLPGMKNYLL